MRRVSLCSPHNVGELNWSLSPLPCCSLLRLLSQLFHRALYAVGICEIEIDCAKPTNVERNLPRPLDEVDDWFLNSVPYGQFVKDVRVVAGEVSQDEVGILNRLENLGM